MDARVGQKGASRQPRLLDQVIKCFTLELSKRVAAQLEKSKIKKNKASQSYINRDAKVPSQITEGSKVQRVGQKAN